MVIGDWYLLIGEEVMGKEVIGKTFTYYPLPITHYLLPKKKLSNNYFEILHWLRVYHLEPVGGRYYVFDLRLLL